MINVSKIIMFYIIIMTVSIITSVVTFADFLSLSEPLALCIDRDRTPCLVV